MEKSKVILAIVISLLLGVLLGVFGMNLLKNDTTNNNHSNSNQKKTKTIQSDPVDGLHFHYYESDVIDGNRYSLILADHGVEGENAGYYSIQSINSFVGNFSHGNYRIEDGSLILTLGPYVGSSEIFENEENVLSSLGASFEYGPNEANYKMYIVDYDTNTIVIGTTKFVLVS